jgi:predicted metalloprotease with PDZ domain
VKGLNSVQPYDWITFLRSRVYELQPQVPENGISQGGYRLTYNDTEPDWIKQAGPSLGTSFAYSLGFTVSATGELGQVWWNSVAHKAGITPDMHIEAVNDQAFTVQNLRDAVLSAEKATTPIRLLLKRDDQFVTISLDYHGGLRYAHLERVEGTVDRLAAILAPSK